MACESRNDLLNWLNELLQLNIAKIEQCGTGAALCQVMDSIYGDVPLQKVKFSTNQEYEYFNNFKVLQETFTKHAIGKTIPVQRLAKLKFQDNFEFLQWIKRHWDTCGGSMSYDAVGRRGGAGISAHSQIDGSHFVAMFIAKKPAPKPAAAAASMTASDSPFVAAAAEPSGRAKMAKSSSLGVDTPSAPSVVSLTRTVAELRITVDELQRERDFYFSKLREIELIMQMANDDGAKAPADVFRKINGILYATEDGFELPQDAETGTDGDDEGVVLLGAKVQLSQQAK